MAIDDMFGNPATGEVFGKDDLEVKEYLGKALVEDLWNLRATQVYEARRLAQAGGRGVKVAIIDTGINYNHPQLKGSCSPIRGINLSGGSENDFMDTDGHGTFVAGIIAGRDFGIAPEAEIYALTAKQVKANFGFEFLCDHLLKSVRKVEDFRPEQKTTTLFPNSLGEMVSYVIETNTLNLFVL